MSIAFIFWLLMLLWLLFGAYTNRTAFNTPVVWGGNLLLFVLLALVGFQIFGSPVR